MLIQNYTLQFFLNILCFLLFANIYIVIFLSKDPVKYFFFLFWIIVDYSRLTTVAMDYCDLLSISFLDHSKLPALLPQMYNKVERNRHYASR